MINSKEVLRAMNRDLFAVANASSGVAPGTVLSTTPPIALWNPPQSALVAPDREITAIIESSRLAYISGTLGAGIILYAIVDQATTPTGGTDLTSTIKATHGSPLTAICKAYQGATLSGTPAQLFPAFTMASTPSGVGLLKDMLEGEIALAPGKALVLQEVGAGGSSPVVQFSLQWLEVTTSFGQRRID
jgi:hypothetical protein